MKIGIIGLGLIGGSLAKIIKRKNIAEIIAFDCNKKSLEDAFFLKDIDSYSTEINNVFYECNIIFICTPVDKIFDYVNKLKNIVNEDCIITDVGSTKGKICSQLKDIKKINFIGGHPMAGSEKTGYEAAKGYLFENCYYILTPFEDSNLEKINILENFIKSIGAIPLKLDYNYHDFLVGLISHLPHIVASALVNTVKEFDKDQYLHLLAAGGFKDITRIASSNPSLWNSICIDNKKEINEILESFKKNINIFEKDMEKENVNNFFDSAKEYRDSFSTSEGFGLYKTFNIKVDIFDKPGAIATITTFLSVNGINIKNIGIMNNREFENGVLSINFDNHIDKEKSKVLLKNLNYVIYD